MEEEDAGAFPEDDLDEMECMVSEEEDDGMDLVVQRKPAARVSSKAKAKPSVKGKAKMVSEAMDDMNGAEEGDDDAGVNAMMTGRQTFAGRRQPANGLPNLRWAVFRKCFIEHIYPHIHVNRSKHEDCLEALKLGRYHLSFLNASS